MVFEQAPPNWLTIRIEALDHHRARFHLNHQNEIVVDDLMGTVKHIGLKTTRIKSRGGEELVFSNNDLLKSRVRNYKRINLALLRHCNEHGINFAFPTQTIHVATLPR